MSIYFYDSERTLKIKEELYNKILKVENLKEAMDLLDEMLNDFLDIYDNLAKDTDHYKRIVKASEKNYDKLNELREQREVLIQDLAKQEIKYKALLELYFKLGKVNPNKELFNDLSAMQERNE